MTKENLGIAPLAPSTTHQVVGTKWKLFCVARAMIGTIHLTMGKPWETHSIAHLMTDIVHSVTSTTHDTSSIARSMMDMAWDTWIVEPLILFVNMSYKLLFEMENLLLRDWFFGDMGVLMT